MITESGFSKDPSIMPEGIVITFGREMMRSNGGQRAMMQHFLNTMADPDAWWMHKMTNRPTVEFADVYIITLNRLWGKVKFGGYDSGSTFAYRPDGSDKQISWPRLILAGPFQKCPFKRELKGFQGFRYCTQLF